MIGSVMQVRAADAYEIAHGTPSLVLMKNAAAAVLKVLQREDLSQKSICILAGKGNNAGDGFALAEMLSGNCKAVEIVLLADEPFSKDAAYYFERCRACGISITKALPDRFDIYVDAVFGTGFSGQLPEAVAAVFARVNELGVRRVSIDLPSGMNGDSGSVSPHTFCAQETVTFQVRKLCHLLPQCAPFCGKVTVEDIGLSEQALSGIHCKELFAPLLPEKAPTLHKGSAGTLHCFVGCERYQGAATLSISAALRSGCGMVRAFIPREIYPVLAAKISEAVLECCPQEDGGLTEAAVGIAAAQKKPNAMLIGSGLGRGTAIGEIVPALLKMNLPSVLDGDGLFFYRPHERSAPLILTPHIGEFARLCDRSITDITADRLKTCADFAMKNHCVLVLKDSVTLITAPDGRQRLLSRPNPGLAKGGSGDVLAGMIAAFLAQSFDAFEAACAGVWYHAEAAALTAEKLGVYAMLPSDLISMIPTVLR